MTPNAPDLSHWWMPFTANRQFKAAPRLFARAQGMWYETPEGARVLDGAAGLWCVNAGHGRPEIAAAVAHQLETLDYAPPFQMGHPLAFDFAKSLAKIAPGRALTPGGEGLDRIFFTNSGSEAVDTALKIALAYQRAIGQGTRTRLIGRERGYHGVGFGGISVGGMVNNRRAFPTLPATDHLRHTHDLARNAFSCGLPPHGAELADDLEAMVALHGAETIAACIIEPMAGSTGVLLPPVGYLQRLRDICDRHGILLIFDEVITGFGRLGAPFATDAFGVLPDLVTAAKGLTNGAIPMGAVFASRAVHDALMTGPAAAIELFHGYTYSAHPAACAAGMAALDIYAREGLLTRAAAVFSSDAISTNDRENTANKELPKPLPPGSNRSGAGLAGVWADALASLRTSPHVIDIRAYGLVAGIELASREGAPGARGYAALVDCFEHGLLVRTTGDIIALSPPLIISEAEIAIIVERLGAALGRVA